MVTCEKEFDSQEESKELKKSLGLFDATTLVVGSMIGSGIFIVSAEISRQVQSSVFLLLAWLVAGIMTIMAALCYAEYSAALPQAGGQYVFLKKVWGELTGFLYGWALFLVIQTGIIAAVSVAFAKFSGIIIPSISSSVKLFSLGSFSLSTQQFVAISLIALLTFVNSRGAKEGAFVQNMFTVTKILALFGMILMGLFFGLKLEVIKANFAHPFSIPHLDINPWSALGVSLVGSLFASDSWHNVTFIASEIKNARKNLPIALLFGTGLVTALYIFTNIIYLCVLPLSQIQHAKEDIVGVTLVGAILGSLAKIIISIVIMISAFGCVNGFILTGSRVFYAMAKDGLFFKFLAKLGKKSGTPENSLYLQGLWASLLVLSGSFSQLLKYEIFVSLLFYILVIGGLILFRKKFPDIPRPYKTLGYPYLPAIYCIMASIIAANLLVQELKVSLAGLGIVLLGIPVYLFWRRKNITGIEIEEISEESV